MQSDNSPQTPAAAPNPNAQLIIKHQNLLLEIIRELVDVPEAVRVEVVESRATVIFEVYAHPGDFCRIIGKQGRTAEALRLVYFNLGFHTSRRYLIELIEPHRDPVPGAARGVKVQVQTRNKAPGPVDLGGVGQALRAS